MNAPQHPTQFAIHLPSVAELELREAEILAAAARHEPLWLSATLTLAVVFVIVLLVMI